MKNRLFHYTVGAHINKIITDGKILQETDGGVPFKGQRPAVWCTFSQRWEETCNKGWITKNSQYKLLNRDETEKMCNGLYRIEITQESAPHDWNSWKHRSCVPNQIAQKLKNDAIKRGSKIKLWRASFEPITKDNWITVERWNQKKGNWNQDAISMALI